MQQKNLAERYDLEPVPWSRALEALEKGPVSPGTWFLATVRPDGRPHVAGVGAVWQDGKVYVVSGGGCKTTPVTPSEISAVAERTLEFVHVTVDGDRLTGEVIRPDGSLVDHFELRAREGR